MILVEMFMETYFEILTPGETSYTPYCENDHIQHQPSVSRSSN